MSVVKYSTGVVPSIGGKLPNYKGEVHSCVWKTRGRTCLYNHYGYQYDDPIQVESGANGAVSFVSNHPNSAVVDWGDGNIESYEFQYIQSKGYYSLIFRSMLVPYKNVSGDGTQNHFTYGDGTYAGVPPHVYSGGDDNTERVISIVFESGFYIASFSTVSLSEFPNVVSSELSTFDLYYINSRLWFSEIPFNIFSFIPNLTNLSITFILDHSKSPIPSSIFDLVNLKTLNLNSSFDLSDIEKSGIRNVSKLKSLTKFGIEDCYIPKYIKEFNDIPRLTSLSMSSFRNKDGFLLNDSPSFEEVDNINPSIIFLYIFSGYNANERTDIDIDLYGKGIENVEIFQFSNLRYWLIDKFPDYVYEMRSLRETDFRGTPYRDQERADKLIDKWYEHVTGWEHITKSQTASDGKRNQYYGLRINWRILDPTPSGTYQAPSGFELGVQDGNPATPMEKIYVLENNYKQNFNLV